MSGSRAGWLAIAAVLFCNVFACGGTAHGGADDADHADDDLHGSGVKDVALTEKPSLALWSSHWKGGRCIATYISRNTAITTATCAGNIEDWGPSTNMTLMSFGASSAKPSREATIVGMKHHPDGKFTLLYTKDSVANVRAASAGIGKSPAAGSLSIYSLLENSTLKGVLAGHDYVYSAERLDFEAVRIPSLAATVFENGAPIFAAGTHTVVGLVFARDAWWDTHVDLSPSLDWIAKNTR